MDELPMPRDRASALSSLLREKGLVEVISKEEEVVRLTERGRRALAEGLPEEKLLRLLRSRGGSAPVSEVSSMLGAEAPAALGTAQRMGWVRISGAAGRRLVELVRSPGEYELREALEEIGGAGELPVERVGRPLGELRRRGLVEVGKRKRLSVRLTELGVKAVTGEIEVVEEVSKLSRGLIESGRWREVSLKEYDVTALPPVVYPGKLHPYLSFLDEVREILIGMGFEEVKSPIVEAEFWNFDVLFQAQDHPAREVHDSYVVSEPKGPARVEFDALVERVWRTHESGWETGSKGWGYSWSFDIARRLMLRSQMTAASARTLASRREIPLKIFAIDKVFRPEALDRTHSMEFYQCEGVVLGEGLSLKHLFGFIRELIRQLGFEEATFRPAYFPFTEPSAEVYAKHPDLGWIEVAGSGLFRPEVLIPLGYDYPRVQALAWGIGIGRLAMLRMGISDIRDLHSQDLQFLRESPVIWR